MKGIIVAGGSGNRLYPQCGREADEVILPILKKL